MRDRNSQNYQRDRLGFADEFAMTLNSPFPPSEFEDGFQPTANREIIRKRALERQESIDCVFPPSSHGSGLRLLHPPFLSFDKILHLAAEDGPPVQPHYRSFL